ncbi:MAG: nitroreductase family protein [Methanomassiliicoccales archaeon]|nr:nitroreductase family protein [Methanomassiliicoccales archaeon]NYT14638.1 nitroreductase family protein [Methanomassiliicoccales archaeon]
MSNPVIEAISSRRSVRAYKPKSIPRDIMNAIIEAGNQAPSTYPFQPWRFVVVEDPEFKKKLVETTLPFWKNSFDGMKDDPVFSGYYMKAKAFYDATDEPKDMVYYSAPIILFVIGPSRNAVSCALACENIMIAAQSFGLGSCYVGFGSLVKGNAEIVEALELTEEESIYGPIVLGYPKDLPEERAMRTEKKDPTVKWI